MKKSVLFTLTAFIIFACASADKIVDVESVHSQLREAVERREFTIVIDQMAPQRYYSRTLYSNYEIQVNDQILQSNLPYLGQVQVPTVYSSSNKGLNFTEEIKEYKAYDNLKKKRLEIEIKIRNDEDSYNYIIYISYNGKAEVIVRPQKRDFIRFYGSVV